MIESSITFLDSGIGGLPYLDWLRKKHPGLPLAYIADSENFPYGDLSTGEVRVATVNVVRRLLKIGVPRMLVVACNTASVTALEAIRDIAPCPVVGTVPAIKPATVLTAEGPIGVLATAGTVDSPYLDNLVSSFVRGREVVRVAAGDIVRYVEERWLEDGDEGAIPIMENAVKALKDSHVSSVVLGCTHFLHLLKPIREMVGNNVPLIDSRDGVGLRVLSLLENQPPPKKENDVFLVTKSGIGDRRYRRFARMNELTWAGELH